MPRRVVRRGKSGSALSLKKSDLHPSDLAGKARRPGGKRSESAGRRAQDRDRSGMLREQVRRQAALTEFARAMLTGSSQADSLASAARLLKKTLCVDFCLAYELR